MRNAESANKAVQICQRHELWGLIKKVSQYHGGDDAEWLKAYAKEMLENYTIDQALVCFRDLASQCYEKLSYESSKIEPSKEIKYQPPFNSGR